MWPHQRAPFGRAAHMHSNRRGLTQLYNDAKISYENVTSSQRNASANSPYDNDPDVLALRKEFQVQQDRLLAWGIHWADKQAVGGNASGKSKEAGYDVDIDDKVDQAGLGEVVASIMENIRSTLAQSGQLQHPERWREGRGHHVPAASVGMWGAMRSARAREKLAAISPKTERKEWKDYELTTGNELLEKLKESIDLLYALDTTQPDEVLSSKKTKETLTTNNTPSAPFPPAVNRHISIDEAFDTNESAQNVHHLHSHPLYIDFSRLEPMHDPNAAEEPPSYEEAKDNTAAVQPKSVYYFPGMQTYVLVDLTRAKNLPTIPHYMSDEDPFHQAHELSQSVSLSGLLTWDGHLKLLGFTLTDANLRFGLVYALPASNDPTALQACQTLTTSIAATLENETSFPPLEDKFRLAYNIALSATSYLAHNESHGHIKSSNIIFLRENDNPKLGKTLRCPYLLQPVQKFTGEPTVNLPLSATIYHHSDADEVGYGTVPAYDIFSIGLVLLEIGLWRPLTTFWKQKYDRALFHERLRKYYVPKLASKCGTRYMRIVQTCFDAPESLQDKPSHFEAADCLLEIVEELAKCCALDEEGPPSGLDIETFESMVEQQQIDAPQSSKSNVVSSSSTHVAASIPQPRPTPAKRTDTTSKSNQKPPEALRKWPDMDIPQDHLETWNNMLMPRLSKMLRNALKDSMESCSVSLMMIGSTPEKAKTTICVQCHDTARVRETLCNRFKPKSGWGLVVCAGDIRRSGQMPRKYKRKTSNVRRSGADTDPVDSSTEKSREQLYQPWPGCGASIGAWTNEQHLPPVSFGGTIVVDGEPFGMTVHHMLDDPDDIERENLRAGPRAPKRSTAPQTATQTTDPEGETRFMGSEEDLPEALDQLELYDEEALADTSDEEDASDAESNASTIRPDYSVMDEDGDEFFFIDDEDEDEAPDLEEDGEGHSSDESEDEETGSIGDTPSVEADRYDDEDYCITQPAWDDVPENFFSDDPEYRDEEHLLSHSFGLVHASSGLKRIEKDNIKHEVDWALIRIKNTRMNLACNPEAAAMAGLPSLNPPPSNSKSKKRKKSMQGSIFAEPALTAVTPLMSLPKLVVSSTGRSSGRTTGRISQAMSLLKLPGRASFSYSFTVEGGMGIPGDSGAWVYSAERKELCGHILAWSDSLKCAYIAPMEIIFEDLKQRLGATEVRLPSERKTNVPAAPFPETKGFGASTLEENSKSKLNIESNKENTSELTRQIQAQKQRRRSSSIEVDQELAQRQAQLAATLKSLQLNTEIATMPNRGQPYSRPGSKASNHGDSSPMSASSARRSRAGLQGSVSPALQARKTPSPPKDNPKYECTPVSKEFEFICPNEKCAGAPSTGLVTRAIPS